MDVWHTDAWLTMIEGRKKFIMYHPAHLKHVFDERTQTYVDLHAPDLEKFPDFARAVPVEFILGAFYLYTCPHTTASAW